jgi:hypothetical protein
MDDPEVSIVRVKSSMTKSGLNPYVKTGFRFISVNLRIQNPQTTRLVMMPAALPVCMDSCSDFSGRLASFTVTLLSVLISSRVPGT